MSNKKKNNLIVLILILSVITIFLGISLAVFQYFGTGSTTNVIQTGRIVFSYSDADLGSTLDNNINITDALPTSDAAGKISLNSHEYFDFTITASTTSTDIIYEIVAKKGDDSTLRDDTVKLYLTEMEGALEIETPLTGGEVTPTYAELSDTTNPALNGKTIYLGTVRAGEIAYGKNFRLRMWLKDEVQTMDNIQNDKKFTVKVDVAAVGNN